MRSATALTQGLHHHVHRTRGDLPSPSTAVPDPTRTPRLGADASWTVEAVQQVRYHVVRSQGLFDVDNTTLLDGCADAPMAAGERRLVVVDSAVDALHGDRIRTWFDAHDVAATIVALRADEEVKQWDSVSAVIDAMNAFGIDRRREPVLAVGGGVLTDVVGFAASLYRRGTPYLRIPTTLIGLVDAGVGVKTGVNYAAGKNRVGTYAAAKATFLDRTWLSTLDPRHVSNGLAEVLKVALMKSAELFELLERSGRDLLEDRLLGSTPELDAAAATVVAESIHLMLEELQPNLWESTLERCVDYGHTFSPVIEMRALPSLLHGEAVAVDMALTTVIGELRGYVSIEQSARVLAVMRQLGLPTWDDVLAEPGLLASALRDTVRHRDGQQRLPLPVGIGGHRFVNDVTDAGWSTSRSTSPIPTPRASSCARCPTRSTCSATRPSTSPPDVRRSPRPPSATGRTSGASTCTGCGWRCTACCPPCDVRRPRSCSASPRRSSTTRARCGPATRPRKPRPVGWSSRSRRRRTRTSCASSRRCRRRWWTRRASGRAARTTSTTPTT